MDKVGKMFHERYNFISKVFHLNLKILDIIDNKLMKIKARLRSNIIVGEFSRFE